MSEATTFRLVNYNLLAQKLVPMNTIGGTTAEIDRYIQTLQLLNEFVKSNSIICLQELSRSWLGRLWVWFNDRDYNLIHEAYGNNFNDYMGIAIALPKSMNVNKVHVKNMGDYIRNTLKIPNEPRIKGLWNTLYHYVNMMRPSYRQNLKDLAWWNTICNKWNVAITIELNLISVTNYHMPCMFTDQNFMNVHAMAIAGYSSQYENNLLVGDFNFQPNSEAFALTTYNEPKIDFANSGAKGHITEGAELVDSVLRESQTLIIRGRNAIKLRPNIGYETAQKYLEWTCKSNGWAGPFQGVLDYIFYTPRFSLYSNTVHYNSFEGVVNIVPDSVLPDLYHPSDHLAVESIVKLLI